VPADGINAASNKDFGTVPLAARGADYSAWGGRERGDCALPLGPHTNPRPYNTELSLAGISDIERAAPRRPSMGQSPGSCSPGLRCHRSCLRNPHAIHCRAPGFGG